MSKTQTHELVELLSATDKRGRVWMAHCTCNWLSLARLSKTSAEDDHVAHRIAEMP